MIPRQTVSKCAKSIVTSMNLKRGDAVIVQGGVHAQNLLEDIVFECYRVGALPVLRSRSDDLTARIMAEIPKSTLERVPKHLLGAYKETDCLIAIEEFDDPSIMASFPRTKMEARTKAYVPLRKVINGEGRTRGKKWCYAGWPTRKAARFYGVDYDLYQKFLVGGMTVPTSRLRQRCEALERLLVDADEIHVSDPEGTDFELKVRGRRRNLDDGFVSDEDVEANDQGNNLPAGEVFMPPHERWGSGRVFCPLTRDRFSGKIVRDVELSFEKGKLDLKSVRASQNGGSLVKTFRQAQRIDEKTQKRVRTLNVAELGIGCNPKVTKAIGYILTDEKIVGTAHLAFGGNSSFGGTSRSAMHWDFVTVPKTTIVAKLPGGEERTVVRSGRIQKS